MNVLELLKGKKVKVMTDMKVEVELEIDHVEDTSYSRDLEPATRANDWWPASETFSQYTVHFTNGSRKTYNSIHSIEIN